MLPTSSTAHSKRRFCALRASPIAVSLFTLDLVLRGGFFDFMQHFDMSLSHIYMNRQVRGFVWYAFIFRMFYGLTMFKILLSFLWIYGKISVNRDLRRELTETLGEGHVKFIADLKRKPASSGGVGR